MRLLIWLLRWVEGFLYGPLWLRGSDACGAVAEKLQNRRDR